MPMKVVSQSQSEVEEVMWSMVVSNDNLPTPHCDLLMQQPERIVRFPWLFCSTMTLFLSKQHYPMIIFFELMIAGIVLDEKSHSVTSKVQPSLPLSQMTAAVVWPVESELIISAIS
jgi:hypothetical protein